MARVEVKTRRRKRIEHDRLIETGFFQPGDPVELIGGQLIVAEPQGSNHLTAIQAVEEALRAAFGAGWQVRGQGPVALDEESEPEPDVAVVPGSFRDDAAAHPSRPVLVVEVSEPSLALDRHHKGSLYARAGLDDYWIVNLVDRVLEVYRHPGPDPAAPFGWRYSPAEVLGARLRSLRSRCLAPTFASPTCSPEPGQSLARASLSVLGYEHNLSQPVIRLWDDAGHAGM